MCTEPKKTTPDPDPEWTETEGYTTSLVVLAALFALVFFLGVWGTLVFPLVTIAILLLMRFVFDTIRRHRDDTFLAIVIGLAILGLILFGKIDTKVCQKLVQSLECRPVVPQQPDGGTQ